MLPICYEYGLPSGHTADCPTFMNIATETFIKEALTNFFARISSNGPGYVRTADYKRRIEAEERKVERGELQRTTGGLLPSELEEQRKRQPLCMEDLRLALELGDQYLGPVPMVAGQIVQARFLDTKGIETEGVKERKRETRLLNGVNGTYTGTAYANEGYAIDLGDPMTIDEDNGWSGGSVQDMDGLDNVLDACLAIGV
jgi:transcriptional coactivator HFI1/ADA1